MKTLKDNLLWVSRLQDHAGQGLVEKKRNGKRATVTGGSCGETKVSKEGGRCRESGYEADVRWGEVSFA